MRPGPGGDGIRKWVGPFRSEMQSSYRKLGDGEGQVEAIAMRFTVSVSTAAFLRQAHQHATLVTLAL